MTAVRNSGDYEQWIKFFLNAVIISGKSALNTATALIEIKNNDEDLIEKQKYSKRTMESLKKIYMYVLSHPIIDIPNTANQLEL